MAVLNQFCCGCSLKTGTIIIAVLYFIWTLLYVAITAYRVHTIQCFDGDANRPTTVENRLIYTDIETQTTTMADTFGNDLGLRSTVYNALLKYPVTKAELIVGVLLAVGQTTCVLLLLVGAIQEKAGLLIPWMVVQILVVTIVTAVSILKCIAPVTDRVGLIVAVSAITIYVSLNAYFLEVVSSFYETLCENRQGQKVCRDVK